MALKKKYQFFISSTWIDFQNVRRRIFEEILKIGHIPIGMEHFTAGQQLSKEFIKENIRESDIFVLILGCKSESNIDPNEKYTHFEYQTAVDYKKFIMPILISDLKYDEFYNNKTHDRNRELDSFRSEVKTQGGVVIEFYDTENDIINIITRGALAHFTRHLSLKKVDEFGWLRAENVFSAELHGIDANVLTSDVTLPILKDLANMEKITPRLVRDVEGKRKYPN